MLKLWGPTDQTTPKASDRGNPFDSIQTTNNLNKSIHTQRSSSKLVPSGPRTPTTPGLMHHHLLAVPAGVTAATNDSPGGSSTNLTAGLPTTQLSFVSPEFKMQAPPLKRNQTATSVVSTASTLSSPTHSQTSKGQIHVKLIQARGLNVPSLHSRPYVVVQFEHNEFVSREPTSDKDKEVKGIPQPLSRNSSSTALTALAASGIARAFEAASRARSGTSTQSSSLSAGSGAHGASTPGGLLFGSSMSPHNPVWKHEVSLYVSIRVDRCILNLTAIPKAMSRLTNPPSPSTSLIALAILKASLACSKLNLYSFTITPSINGSSTYFFGHFAPLTI